MTDVDFKVRRSRRSRRGAKRRTRSRKGSKTPLAKAAAAYRAIATVLKRVPASVKSAHKGKVSSFKKARSAAAAYRSKYRSAAKLRSSPRTRAKKAAAVRKFVLYTRKALTLAKQLLRAAKARKAHRTVKRRVARRTSRRRVSRRTGRRLSTRSRRSYATWGEDTGIWDTDSGNMYSPADFKVMRKSRRGSKRVSRRRVGPKRRRVSLRRRPRRVSRLRTRRLRSRR